MRSFTPFEHLKQGGFFFIAGFNFNLFSLSLLWWMSFCRGTLSGLLLRMRRSHRRRYIFSEIVFNSRMYLLKFVTSSSLNLRNCRTRGRGNGLLFLVLDFSGVSMRGNLCLSFLALFGTLLPPSFSLRGSGSKPSLK